MKNEPKHLLCSLPARFLTARSFLSNCKKNILFGWQWFPNKCDYCVSIQGGRPPPFWAVSEYTPFSLCLRHRASLIVIFLVTMKLYLAVKNNIKKVNVGISQKIAIFCSMIILLQYLTCEHSVAASPHFAFSRNASVCKAFAAIT